MKNAILYLSVFSILAAISLNGCYYDNVEELYPRPNDTLDTVITFEKHIQPFITTTCATSSGCHASGSNYPVLETFDQVKANIDRIEIRAAIEKTMPPSGPKPTQKELDDLRKWIDEGMKYDNR